MTINRWNKKFYETTRGRILGLLRRGDLTVDHIARELQLTDNAVRAHLAALERDGLIEQGPARRGGVGKPAFSYRVATHAEPLFSRAYLPVLRSLLDVLAERFSPAEFETMLRAVGRRIAAEQGAASVHRGERVAAAVELLTELGGVADVVEQDGIITIRGLSCPLGAAVQRHPAVCSAIEALLTELIGTPVHERCDRGERPRCCFELSRAVADASGSPH